MISFMLLTISLKTVAIAALVGMVVAWVVHYAHRHLCKHDSCCNTKQSCAPGQKCDQGYPSLEKHDECCCNCSFACLAVYKVVAYGLAFVQAYGIAYLLERLNLLGDYKDAILLTLFVAIAFWATKKAACVMWHHKSWSHFVCKIILHFIVLAAMAAMIVYLS